MKNNRDLFKEKKSQLKYASEGTRQSIKTRDQKVDPGIVAIASG
jgi:hypothetical protein